MTSFGSILWLVAIGLLFFFMMRKSGGCCGGGHGGHEEHDNHGHGNGQDDKHIDPVCSMEVDPESAQHTSEYKGDTMYFCSDQCLEKFENDPESYSKSFEKIEHQRAGCH